MLSSEKPWTNQTLSSPVIGYDCVVKAEADPALCTWVGAGAHVGELGAPATVQTFTYSDVHNQQHGVRLVLECLREVGSICPPVQVRR